MYQAEQVKSNDYGIREQYDSIIKQTRRMIKTMTIEQRFDKAKSHIIDALKNKQPRPMTYSPQLTTLYYVFYFMQSSLLWDWLTFLLSYFYMYLVILDNQSYVYKISLEGGILLFFFIDSFIDYYLKSFDQFRKKNKYPTFYFWKSLLLLLMSIDLIIFATLPCFNTRPIRPFRILRAFIPVFFDPQIRKSLLALASAYKQILVFIIYYTIIIVGFAFIGTQSLTFDPNYVDPNFPQKMDPYINDYAHLDKMIFQVYAMATYDYFPDHQILAVQNFQPNYIYFIVFVFFNMFLFASIPGSLIYNKFRQMRSRYILVDEIKQQHSLILGFVSLAQEQNNLSIQVLIKFLFYFYRNKIRYVEYITDICLKLDDNNNQTIQVNEFMQLSKIMLYNSIMFPPTFDDIALWVSFRTFMNQSLKLKAIVNHWIFDIGMCLSIILCFVNALILLYSGSQLSKIFDTVFIWFFLAELMVRLIGIGPQNFFADRWNNIDGLLILLNIVFAFVKTGTNIDNLFIIFRVSRVALCVRLILTNKFVESRKFEIVQKLKRLFATFLQIMPIIVRFFLLFAFFFFIFGILSMQIFYNSEQITDDNSNYNNYIQFSNFKTFIRSQFVMMQILTEGGWSIIAFDYCWRNPSYYGLIVVFFIFMHLTIVTINGTLLKGIFWEIYFTVSSMMDDLQQKIEKHARKQEENDKKTLQINQIHQQLSKNQSLEPNTVLKRQIIEKKLDIQILKRIKIFHLEQQQDKKASQRSLRSINRSKIVEQIMQNWNISAKQLQLPRKRKYSANSPKLRKKKAMDFKDIQNKQQQDFQQQMQQILNGLIISSKLKYSQIIAYPKVFVQFLNCKFKHPQQFISQQKFDIAFNPLYNEQSMNFHIYEMNGILGLQNSLRQKKSMIVECLTNNGLINVATAEKIIKTKLMVKKFHIDSNGALRKMYLSQTNEDLIKKLQIQYFSDVYGNSFKKINKITLEPLLKFEATLNYTLWNILSYPQIDDSDFFHLITHIQDQMSNKLLKMGSLVKFVYKVDHESDIWFLVQHKKHQQMQIRFIKTGLWAYTNEMAHNKTYYARDIFNWDFEQFPQENGQICQQYMKLFFQSFETLAFSLIDKKPFFQSNPKQHIYDLYTQNFQIPILQKLSGHSQNQLKVSNIMLIILSREQQRIDFGEQMLPYNVSDIACEPRRIKKQDFILDEQDKQTFEKLKNLAAMDHQKIIQSQGLPFSYVINLMKHISDLVKLYHNNFIGHIERALNQKYQQVNFQGNEEEVLSMPEIVVNLHE